MGVLLDARWMNVRGKHGRLLGVKADFEVVDKLLETAPKGFKANATFKNLRNLTLAAYDGDGAQEINHGH